MPFQVSARTLERLEWPALVARLAQHVRTPRGSARLARAGIGFEESLEGMRARLAETTEARRVLDDGDVPPLGGVRELGSTLTRLGKAGLLTGGELEALGETLAASAATAAFLRRRADLAPALAALGEALADHGELAREIERCIDPEGIVKDEASPALSQARREAHSIAAEVQRRIARFLQDPEVADALQDSFYTVRGDRYVLPVRADARSRVPGIVHDASATGTTLFVEPQAVVELNNRLKQAELTVERETRRVLQALSGAAAQRLPEIEANLALLEHIDLAFARGALSGELDGVEPRTADDGVFDLPQLRHPLLPRDEAVPNHVALGRDFRVLVISGPNAGGKTVAMKALALAVLCARAGLHVPAGAGARVAAVERLLADIGDAQDIRESLSTFSAHMANLASILEAADARSLVALDEVGVGTDPSEGAALAQAVLESLAEAEARVVATTHYNLLKEMAAVDARFANASVAFDAETLAPTYRLVMGTPGSSSATAVAARMGMRREVLERANALLDREDRRLDRMLAELATSRAALERERREAHRLRQESESARNEYRARLERLQERRDKLFASMRADLEQAFRQAHADVATVIRELQRGTARPQDAARAKERLRSLERRARAVEAAHRPAAPPRERVDWRRARPGDAVELAGGRRGTLASLPDRHGRVTVRMGSARMQLPADQVAPSTAAPPSGPTRRVSVEAEPRPAGPSRLDLRGLRVDEALDRVTEALDAAAAAGRERLEIIHGIGSGALRDGVRAFLRDCAYVERFESGDPQGGGEGVTWVHLRE